MSTVLLPSRGELLQGETLLEMVRQPGRHGICHRADPGAVLRGMERVGGWRPSVAKEQTGYGGIGAAGEIGGIETA